MTAPTRELDLARMRQQRHAKLQQEMQARSIDALLLLGSGNVMYASGAQTVLADNARRYQQRLIVLVVAGDDAPHVFTPYADGLPPDLPASHRHGPLYAETDAGVEHMARTIKELTGGAAARIGVDDYTAPMWFGLPRLLAPAELVDATQLCTDARLFKLPDEQECMRRSWEINEAATYAAEQVLRPGVRLNELSGVFLRRLFELGATANFLDPVFQAMPERIADGPWSTNGDVPFNLITTDHIISEGEVIWTDTVMGYEGYASDVGRTWVAGRPSRTLRDLYVRWQEITDAVISQLRPGVTGDVLTRLAIEANGGTKPWLDHFFLAHGLGLEGGEPQQVGADRGPEYDEQFVLQPGMAIVVEPVTWLDGHAGWRCEELVFITDDGHERVSHYPNEPFE
ncbi:MAG TPA: Xaa-Pro peptidase family protein [Acidimicrobiia bacterium]|jgi:Xaa-Pro aminopeptidase